MSVVGALPQTTSVLFKGLDNLVLPFTSKVLEGMDSSAYNTAQVDDADKYIVKSITGLEPPDQTIAIAKTASGGKYQGRQSEDREIVVLIKLNPDWDSGETPKMLRDNLYTMLSTGYDPKVVIQLAAGIFPYAQVVAYVSKFEAAIFDANPVVQITFECLNPTFSSLMPISLSPGELDEKHPNVYNPGTAETGFQFSVKFTDDLNGWSIKQAENQSVGMIFDMQFHENDILSVSTIPGKRYIHWNKHRGKVTNKMGILTNSSEWITLHPGNNLFVIPKSGQWDWNGQFAFTPQYWGI